MWNLSVVDFSHTLVSAHTFQWLLNHIRTCKCRLFSLNCTGVRLNTDSVVVISDIIKHSPCLHTLLLEECSLSGGNYDYLTQSIFCSKSLETVSLAGNAGGSSARRVGISTLADVTSRNRVVKSQAINNCLPFYIGSHLASISRNYERPYRYWSG